jgi:DNA-directed RNA polymerase sigma subunit (sigma70/sigma32)
MRNGFHAHSKTFAKRAVIVREDAAVAPAGRLTDAEMAARLGTLPCVVRGIRATERMVSLDSDVGTDSGLEAPGAIKDCLGGDDPAFGEIDMKHDFDAIMAIAKEVLTERERYVVRRSVMEGASNIAIGKEIGRSHERARQIREEALDKVRRARAKREVAV